ncbi:hypothetical protein CYMTET_45862 [Cymbomonas tetramitiformis]|uniref:Uncharacterized protein n=1 Tax=Cymbomonas tetramitiformis TaxID=36881 RepID=A0AAE0BXC6_9CHLO|nr:hypothetical protein CYMTET_45862 [Cymbomonas tetramitiformis]
MATRTKSFGRGKVGLKKVKFAWSSSEQIPKYSQWKPVSLAKQALDVVSKSMSDLKGLKNSSLLANGRKDLYPRFHDFGVFPKPGGVDNRSRAELRAEDLSKLNKVQVKKNVGKVNQEHESNIYKGGASAIKSREEHERGMMDLDRDAFASASNTYGDEHVGFDTFSQISLGYRKMDYSMESRKIGDSDVPFPKLFHELTPSDPPKGTVVKTSNAAKANSGVGILWITR